MFENLSILKQAQAMASHAGARQSSIARNIANADTPGYRPTDIAPFAQTYRDAAEGAGMRQTRAGHLGAESGTTDFTESLIRQIPGATSPNGNGVSVETEMMKSAEVRHQHDMALAIYQNAIGVLKASIGRQR